MSPRAPAPARARLATLAARAATCAAAALLATMSGCTSEGTDPQPHDLEVAVTPPTGTFTPGQSILWTVTVINKGPGQSGPVTLSDGSGTCTAVGNATCPAAGSRDVPSMPPGGKLTLDFTKTLAADGLGSQDIAFSVSSTSDTVSTNDSIAVPIPLVGLADGTYTVYSADGYPYQMVLNFETATWSVTGSGANLSGTLTSEKVGEQYVYLTGTGARLRTVTQGLVGQGDFGGGMAPFVAATHTLPYLYQLGIVPYNVVGRTWQAGTWTTTLETYGFVGSAMTACTDTAPHTLADCPAGHLRHFTVTVTDASPDFTAVNDDDASDTMTFRLITLNLTTYLVRTDTDLAGARHFRLGLIDNAGPTAGSYSGGDAAGHWNSLAITGSATGSIAFSRVAPDDLGSADTATFVDAGTGSPAGLRLATRASDSGALYFATSDVLGAFVGTATGPSAGTLMIVTP